jgi:hypothetical protein
MSALMVAAAWANHGTLSELLACGADPNQSCHDTCDWGTPLNAAIAWSRGEEADIRGIVETLLRAGAVPDEQTLEHARWAAAEKLSNDDGVSRADRGWEVELLQLLEEHAQ